MNDTRYARGLAQLQQVEGNEHPGILSALADIAPDLARLAIEFGYGDVYARPGLAPRHRQLATIAMLAALGNARPQLKFHIHGALNVGCTPAEVVETLMHIVVYAGIPAGLNGIFAAKEVFEERQLSPASYTTTTAAPLDSGQRYREGWAALGEIDGDAGLRVIESLGHIAPDLGRLVIEFAFGDIYTRPGLDLLSREIVTVAALAAMGTATTQLKVHVHGLLNVGGTQEILVETILHTAPYAGFPAAINAMLAAQAVLAERGEHISQ
ncbi:carboxymuconolactone decarboxylase family protein [Chitinimonas naiadis]